VKDSIPTNRFQPDLLNVLPWPRTAPQVVSEEGTPLVNRQCMPDNFYIRVGRGIRNFDRVVEPAEGATESTRLWRKRVGVGHVRCIVNPKSVCRPTCKVRTVRRLTPAHTAPKCDSKCIHKCPSCHTPIQGQMRSSGANDECPSFCHRCGTAYPWMEDKLRTAKDLLFRDDKLTYEDKKELWDLLKYVMSNPKAELAKGKSKLIMIKIQKAAEPIEDFVADVITKYAVEMSKG